MICSMTGYATAAREFAWGVLGSSYARSTTAIWTQFRLPDELRSLEPQLREA